MFTVAFYGKTAHAGASPHLGRSALDACELMNVGCNYLREHITPDARVHYAYENAGNPACNIVPDYCKMTYGVRALKIRDVREIAERVKNVGRGAALMTDTRVEFQSVMCYSDFFQNTVIASILSDAMNEIGAPQWAESDYRRAAELIQNYDAELSEALEDMIHQRYPQSEWEQKKVQPLDTAVSRFSPTSPPLVSAGSTDVGDVAYAVPAAYMFVACCNMAAPGHSWYMTGNAGGEIGHKGMLTAGKILALACAKVFAAPQLLEDARQEWKQTTGGHYECPMPNESGGME